MGISSLSKRRSTATRRRVFRDYSRLFLEIEALEERRVLSITPTGGLDDDGNPTAHDSTRFTTPDGQVYFVDPPYSGAAPAAGAPATANAPYPLDQTFKLHSLPAATKKIYLDFNGHTITGTLWNDSKNGTGQPSIVIPAYNFEGTGSSFTNNELERIQQIWERVAEDFAPFNIDVTTEEPPLDALINTGGGDQQYGVRVAIGGSSDLLGISAGGVAYLDSFGRADGTPALVFPDDLANGHEKYTAEATSHEVGHTLSLEHDGDNVEDYYVGHGTGPTGWAPIMGVGYDKALVQWSKGEYPNANNTAQDDLQIITTQHGFGYRTDDVPNTLANARPLTIPDFLNVSTSGIISTGADIDFYSFQTNAGLVELNIDPFYRSPNLDVLATLYDSGGAVLATSNPTGGLDAFFSLELDAGTYYVSVEGVGEGNLQTGYSDYGSLGYYTITGTIQDARAVTISGRAWNDADADGVWDAAETALAGVQVFIDANFNGVFDSGEATQTTAADGAYSFDVAAPNSYRVGQIPLTGWERTYPAGDGLHRVSVATLAGASNVNFGSRPGPGSISGMVWADDNDGLRETGEPGLRNMTVYVDLDNDGKLDLNEPAAVTDSQGRYTINGVRPGTYTLRSLLTPGWQQSAPANPLHRTVSVGPGQTVTGLEFGHYLVEDYGDAPELYNNGATAGVAKHGILPGFQMGAQLGVDDGVRFLTGLHPGQTEKVVVEVHYNGYPSAYIQAWIDFNGDGDWNDAGEQIIKNYAPVEGFNTISFQVPAGANLNPSISPQARFRFGYERDFTPYGTALAGEVEDYDVSFPQAPDTGMRVSNDIFNVVEDSVDNTLNVLANDALGPGGGNLIITQLSSTSAGGTIAIINAGKQVRYTPLPNFNGVETFTYTVVDGLGGQKTATVVVNVSSVNDPPTAQDDFFDVDVNSTGNLLNVLANDSISVDPGEVLAITAVGATSNGGIVSIQNGVELLYTPAAAFVGLETFTYTISDGNGGFATATVSVNVAPLPDLVRFSVKTKDLNGAEINSIGVDEEFVVEIYAQDLRVQAQGVFSAFLDLFYNQGLVAVVPDTFESGPEYGSSERDGSAATGVVDDSGSVVNDIADPLDGGEYLLYKLRFRSLARGQVTFQTDPVDQINLEVLLFGSNNVVPEGRIDFGFNQFNIVEFGAAPDAFSVEQNTNANSLNVLANDSLGPQGGTLQITAIGALDNGGTASITNNGTRISYTPAAGFLGVETFTYTVIDGLGNSAQATVTVTVTPPNNPPTANDDSAAVLEDSQQNSILVLTNDVKEAGETLTIIGVTQGSQGGTIQIAAGGQSVIYSPAPNFHGTETFTYTINDGKPGNDSTATVSVTVLSLNDPPVANDDTYTGVAEDSVDVVLTVLTNDSFAPDLSETLKIVGVAQGNQGGVVKIAAGGQQILYTPKKDFFGTETFTYTINDGDPNSTDTATVSVTVAPLNDPPTANPDLVFVDRNSAQVQLNVLANDSGLPDVGETLTIIGISSATTPNGGTLQINASGTALLYQPAANYLGFDTFTYTINDGTLGSNATATVTVWVEPATFPKARPDFFSVRQESVNNALNVLANDLASPGGTLSISTFTQPAQGTITAGPGGALYYTPPTGFVGTTTFTYTVVDGVGTPATSIVTIDVEELQEVVEFHFVATDLQGNVLDKVVVGDTFVLNVYVEDIQDQTTNNPAVGVYSAYLDLLYSSSVVSALSGSIVYGPNYGAAASGDLSTPGLVNEVGAITTNTLNNPPLGGDPQLLFSIRFHADTLGLVDFTSNIADLPLSEVLLFNSSAALLAPEIRFDALSLEVVAFGARNDVFNIIENSSNVPLDVLANDQLGPGGGTLQITAAQVVDGGGTLTVVGGGAGLQYTPAPDFVGVVTFNYTVIDGLGNTAIGQGIINVLEQANLPKANDDNYNVLEDSGPTLLNVLANDVANPTGTLSITAVGAASSGLAEIFNNQIRYTPAAGFSGLVTFTYTVTDGVVGSVDSTATVSVFVQDIVLPFAHNDQFNNIPEDSTNFQLDVLANDDVSPGGSLQISEVNTAGLLGTVTIGPGNTFLRYTPAPNFYGTETFSYTVIDGVGDPSTASVSVTVVNTNDPPTANPDSFQVTRDSSAITLNVLGNDSFLPDPAETLTITSRTLPATGGAVTIINGGTALQYTPPAGYIGLETFEYTLSDGHGGTAIGTVTIDVQDLDKVAFTIELVDPATNQPITQVTVGSTVKAIVKVQDIRPNPQGVYSAYLDLVYDNTKFTALTNSLVHDTTVYGSGGVGTFTTGRIINVGSFLKGITAPSPPGASYTLFSVNFLATAAGDSIVFGTAEETSINYEVSVFPQDLVEGSAIQFNSTSIKVNPSAFVNPINAYDVNGDGKVSALDALTVINELINTGGRNLTTTYSNPALAAAAPAVPKGYVDANGDGRLTALDALTVINQLILAANGETTPTTTPTPTPLASKLPGFAAIPLPGSTTTSGSTLAAMSFTAPTATESSTSSAASAEGEPLWGVVLAASGAAPTGTEPVFVDNSNYVTVEETSAAPTLAPQAPAEDAVEFVFSEPRSSQSEDELEAALGDIADEVANTWYV